jgi:hypothetical protein
MSVPASGFVTYLWHYVVARLLYDDLVHPLVRGEGVALAAVVGIAVAVAVVVLRLNRRRS